MTWERFQEFLAGKTHTRRLMTLAEMANVAVFMASDKASGMTIECKKSVEGKLRRLIDQIPNWRHYY